VSRKNDFTSAIKNAEKNNLKIVGLSPTKDKKERTKAAQQILDAAKVGKKQNEINTYKTLCLLCDDLNIPHPIAELRFHKRRRWRTDFYFTNGHTEVVLEVEGGVFQVNSDGSKGGRHNNGKGFIEDMKKYNALAEYGIWLIRCIPQDLLKTTTLKRVKKILER